MDVTALLQNQFSILVAGVFLAGSIGCSTTEQAAEPSGETVTEEMVEVGYGVQSKESVTGSVSSISAEEIDRAVHGEDVVHVEQLLQGRVAGVEVYRTGMGDFAVRIRGRSSLYGSNQPLYIVDGMPFSPPPGRGLIGVNPADIASIHVIKDGTTAVYGSRGANGVVIIKTKGVQ